MLNRDIVLTERTPQEFATEHELHLFTEDSVAVNRAIVFRIETFEPTEFLGQIGGNLGLNVDRSILKQALGHVDVTRHFVNRHFDLSVARFRAGAGIGIRYATPFGPLRLDVAVPLRKYDGGSDYGIYAGIGQSF